MVKSPLLAFRSHVEACSLNGLFNVFESKNENYDTMTNFGTAMRTLGNRLSKSKNGFQFCVAVLFLVNIVKDQPQRKS
jgi:hypothetical protein